MIYICQEQKNGPKEFTVGSGVRVQGLKNEVVLNVALTCQSYMPIQENTMALISVCYYLELHNVITSHLGVHVLLMKVQQVVRML